MKIVLLGYGKMGQLIEKFAQKRGHEVILVVDQHNRETLTAQDIQDADVAIDFSVPSGALENISLCFEASVPLVVGTTGWYDHLDEVKDICLETDQSLLYGSNFSIGVNIFFHINKMLAKAIQPYHQYDVQVEEIHHVHKLDAPSGTAITIAEGILNNSDIKQQWVNELVDDGDGIIPKPNELLIESLRIEEVPGTHTVLYSSEVDQIEFKHIAHNREGFALGAVIAAEWLQGKKGFYQVTEMFDFNK
ncbi:4-hydroxy-tetrahydrodipicolinate reductase [Sphingobacterium spiritivorum]|uniref:4-hydroxy-tetrahydrodipicolinate reductase n=1 Tax=Sphingobacterium spiritivorum ATCC 33861 TaxID=525373 RepID=D7VLC2_SPHSI|nr:4-hydroxy-tetrahydrodipicolinate reductase [Sphingobacterium spiritivorum]EFK58395.1 dihydrodipicolinate reductase [Sphingobacterium spiritivorum ATCC 33861]QQT37141.1 4-hydroxy-tetrahydrodipicolinate reductase [Sphingobacterium spiritivorum]WQD33915.1 4-hydroxy-tetrahydrodipicolinate reductase [Sphingobacterium spiritivorum]SUJ28150.1 Dihydrodipicolinate reductase [Sphingobacterium spiritivorum]